ncbi:phytase [Novosphingobium profundi]|uniref:phytase n=1 Tax=Novosphingobium profundi TaxID=1774954 RepID=UPI001CFED745|nr:phytase [Novosphingobium profundi]
MKTSFTNLSMIVKQGSGALLPALLLGACATTPEEPAVRLPAVEVPASGETKPVGTVNDDAADDPAIWRNRADPAASLVLGTDKKAGLYVYGLDGEVRDFAAAGRLNNVDLREVTLASGQTAVLVAASDRGDEAEPRIALFWLDTATGKLRDLGTQTFLSEGHRAMEAYGFCMGAPLGEGELARAYVVMKDGTVAESALTEVDGAVHAAFTRDVKVATQAEGCVIDDATHTLYLAEEDVGIWQVDLSAATLAPEALAKVGAKDGLVDDVEGLALARGEDGKAWLLASSQGDSAYAVFTLPGGAYAGRFRINGGDLGGTSETDGIEVALGDFGPKYPGGVFMAQDGDNAPYAQNFKLVAWDAIRAALKLD